MCNPMAPALGTLLLILLTVGFGIVVLLPYAMALKLLRPPRMTDGKAVYHLNQDWVEVEAGDFMWLRAFCPQACYAGGPGNFRYLLYKDVNRHAKLGGFGR